MFRAIARLREPARASRSPSGNNRVCGCAIPYQTRSATALVKENEGSGTAPVFQFTRIYPTTMPLLRTSLRTVRERYATFPTRHNRSAIKTKLRLEFSLNRREQLPARKMLGPWLIVFLFRPPGGD